MKKLLLLFLGMALATVFNTAHAQIADGSVLTENIIITDLDGNTHDIFSILDEGRTVVFDLFATWCGPCWSYHNSGALKNLYNYYGDGEYGTGEVFVMAIETDPSTPVSAITGGAGATNGWNWTTGIPYPIANHNSLGNLFQQAYYPYIIRICPNRQIFELGQENASVIMSHVGQCISGSGLDFDPGIIAYSGESDYCDQAEIKVDLQNLGSENLTQATIHVILEDDIVIEHHWTGDLAMYEIENVTLGSIDLVGDPTLLIEIVSDQELSFGSITQEMKASKEGTTLIQLRLKLDSYPTETSWDIKNSEGTIIASGGSYPTTMANQLIEQEFQLEEMGCYSFTIYDVYGDGLNAAAYGGINGFYQIKSGGSTLLAGGSNKQFKKETKPFKATEVQVGIENLNSPAQLSIFPNPASDMLNINLEMAFTHNVTIAIYDIVGKVVYTKEMGNLPPGQSKQSININHLNDGVYFVNTTIGENTITSKLIVRK